MHSMHLIYVKIYDSRQLAVVRVVDMDISYEVDDPGSIPIPS